jgi:hypothetical protein
MISYEQYAGPWTIPSEYQPNAVRLLYACEDLYNEMVTDGVVFRYNPKTKTQVSGEVYGGFRPQDCPIGAAHSSHKEGLAVDWYDPLEEIDNWCMAHQERLKAHGIYIEHPDATPRWSHWTIKAPGSGNTVFHP